MSGERTPGRTGSIPCVRCGSSVCFNFTGGPHRVRCPGCKKPMSLEVVHDGRKWKVKRPTIST